MNCKDCARYDFESRKCLDHKINPHSWDQAINVANVMGIRSICMFNDYRERLVHSRALKLPPAHDETVSL